MQPIIDIDHVTFSYGTASQEAITDISLTIEPGEFIGIIGPSGAGKSTLAAVMSGAVPHHYTGTFYGAAHVNGEDTCEISLTDISRTVGSVLQDIDAQMVASVVEDELLFGLENFGVPHQEIPQRLTWAAKTVGIVDLMDREIATLSGGQQQKVAIAAILAMRPRVLVLDEPTAALDPESSRSVFETLRTINQIEDVTVVVVEQKVALLSEFCSRLIVLNKGRIAHEGTPAEVFSHARELRALGVDSPRTVRVSNSLRDAGLIPNAKPCLTVDACYKLISSTLTETTSTISPACAANAAVTQKTITTPAPTPHTTTSQNLRGKRNIVLDDVSFSYSGSNASVNNLSFEVYSHEVVALIGQNGAGKTTATKLINGLLKPSSGTVLVDGLNTCTTKTSEIARHCATLFQNPDHQICKDTVLNEVAFSLELTGVDHKEACRRALPVIERFGLPQGEAPFSLSRGQRQMVALASVVVLEPAVVILDEPTSGLDYRECMTVMETIRELAQKGSAVLMVCHDMEVVADFASRVIVMAHGNIVGAGPTFEVFSQPALMQQAYLAPPQMVELTERLTHHISPAFSGLTEVADIVHTVKELMNRG